MIFDAEADYISTLGSTQLVKLMKRLLLAEARKTDIPLRAVSVPLQITVPDGGEDGRISWTGGEPSTDYIPSHFTIFQAKAQKLNETMVKREVLEKSPKGKPALNKAVTKVLAQNGAYVIFCSQPMTGQKRQKLKKAICDAIVSVGENPKNATAIEVYDANLIADWVNCHPAVALWLASVRGCRNLAGFQTHEGWSRDPDNSVPWQLSDEPRFVPTNPSIQVGEHSLAWTFEQAAANIREFLGAAQSIVRIYGPSGFGKSRFVYEVLKSSDSVSDQIDTASVIFCDGSITGDEVTKLALECADTHLTAILVVDECNDELHRKIAKLVGRSGSQLRLITMNIETKITRATDTLSLRVERADDKLIGEIAKGVAQKLPSSAISFITKLADGFPRMAVLGAQQGGGGRQTIETVEQIIDRILWAGKPQNEEALRALEVAALFEWIGIEGRVKSQAAFVAAKLAEQTVSRFVEYVLSFEVRGIITRRGDYLQVGPVPLAARLGIHRLSVMTSDQLLDFFEQAPADLGEKFLRRLKWMDTSPIAKDFSEHLLAENMYGSYQALNNDAGASVLYRLVEVAPDATMCAIERVFGTLTTDELKAASGARRNLVWCLEKLVFRKETFDSSARLLLRLAVAEIENFANNATGIFQQLYQLHLSGTEADPAARLAILDEGLLSSNDAERKVCIDALGNMLNSDSFRRTGGAEQIGSAEALQDWSPRTYGEMWNFFRAGMTRLTDIAASNNLDANIARKHLGVHIRELLNQLPIAEIKSMIETVTAQSGFWPEAIIAVSDWLYYDRRRCPSSERQVQVRQLYSDLLPSDPVDLAILYTHGWPIDLKDPDRNYNKDHGIKADIEYAKLQAIRVAETIAKDDILTRRAIARMSCLEAHSVAAFSEALIKNVTSPEQVFEHAIKTAVCATGQPNISFFTGLISGAFARDPALGKKLVRLALNAPKLHAHAINMIAAGSLEADEIALVISLLENGDIKPWECQNLHLARVSVSVLLPLLDQLEKHGADGLWTIIDIIDSCVDTGKKKLSVKLITKAKHVLISHILFDEKISNMDAYHIETLIKKLMIVGELNENYVQKLSSNLLKICSVNSYLDFNNMSGPVFSVLNVLVKKYPKTVWDEISKKLMSTTGHDSDNARSLLEDNIRSPEDHLGQMFCLDIPLSQVFEWVREDPKQRAAMVVSWLPIAVRGENDVLSWHPELEAYIGEFGSMPGVLETLSLRLRPTSWWGSLAAYLEPVVSLLQTCRSHQNPLVRSWASEQIAELTQRIQTVRKNDAEDIVRHS